MTLRRLLPSCVIFLGVLLLVNAAILAVVGNFNAGLAALVVVALGLMVYGVLWLRQKAPRWLHGVVIGCCAVIAVFSGFLALYGGHNTARPNEDAIIVLGAGVHGQKVTTPLARRLDAALAYFQKNPRVIIVVSGGQGPQEDIPEAQAMELYLIARGVPAAQIIKEDKSTSTYENFAFSDKLLRQKFPDGYAAAFITNKFHVYRADRIARSEGVVARHIGAPLDWYVAPSAYLREMMAVFKFWL